MKPFSRETVVDDARMTAEMIQYLHEQELTQLRIEQTRLKLDNELLRHTASQLAPEDVVPMIPTNRRNTFAALDGAVADSVKAPGLEPLFSVVDGLIAQGVCKTREEALAFAKRARPDIKSTPALDDAIVNGAAANRGLADPALRVQNVNDGRTGSGGGRAYGSGGRFEGKRADQIGMPVRNDEHELVKLFAEAGAPNIASADAGHLAESYGNGQRVRRFLDICREKKLSPTRAADKAEAERILFAASTVATAQTQLECLYAIAKRQGWRLPERGPDCARILASERPDLCSYGSRQRDPEPEVLRLSEHDRATQFDEAIVDEMVRNDWDPWDPASRRKATERLLLTKPHLVPSYGWKARR